MKKQVKKVVITTLVVVAVLGAFYGISLYLNSISGPNYVKDVAEAYIQYDEILAGNTFSSDKNDYSVVYFDREDEFVTTNIMTAINENNSTDNPKKIYIVDMSNAINSKYVSEKTNTKVSNLSELEIGEPTLINIKNGKVTKVITNTDEIVEYIK